MPSTKPKPRKAKVEAPHHNATIDLDDLTTIAEGIVAGDTNETVAAKINTSLAAVSVHHKKFKEVELPLYFPETVDEWRNDVIKFMQIAVWKGTQRLAMQGIDEMDVRNVPVAVGIISDKLNGYMGNPTSVAVIQHQVVRHDSIADRLKAAKEAPIDA
jgi:hypothetical protein